MWMWNWYDRIRNVPFRPFSFLFSSLLFLGNVIRIMREKSDDKMGPFLLVSFVNIRQLKLDSICRMIMKFALEKVISKWIKWQQNIYFISKCDCCYSENDPNSEGVTQSVEVVEVLGNSVQPLAWHWLWQMRTFNDDSHAQWLCSVYTVTFLIIHMHYKASLVLLKTPRKILSTCSPTHSIHSLTVRTISTNHTIISTFISLTTLELSLSLSHNCNFYNALEKTK